MSIKMTNQTICHVLQCARLCVAVTIKLTILNLYVLLESCTMRIQMPIQNVFMRYVRIKSQKSALQ